MRQRCDLSDFDSSMDIGTRLAAVSISEITDVMRLSRTTISMQRMVQTREDIQWNSLCENVLLMAKITGERKNYFKLRGKQQERKFVRAKLCRWTHNRWNLEADWATAAEDHTENRKLRSRFTWAQQSWTLENWKTISWSDGSQLQHLDGRFWTCCKQHENMDPSCLD